MFNKTQLALMFQLQHDMNAKVNPEWITAGNDWTLASMMEAVEAIGHHGWKWWKKQNPDIAQLQMELVDIWHFMLSEMIISGAKPNLEDLVNELSEIIIRECNSEEKIIKFNNQSYDLSKMNLVELLKLFVGFCTVDITPIVLFAEIMNRVELTSDELYRQYVGKNVLNFFRQNNGYKDGTYIKIWYDGREDNEHLVEILNGLDMSDAAADIAVYDNLKVRYSYN
jgi:hypothetical protein|tara:strand:- start:369 stop:1043 length:675 start_codon:yes stop_codon:yes gene_type:complete